MTRPRPPRTALLVGLALLAACSGAAADDAEHEVVLTEKAIGAPSSWAAGEQVLEVHNEGDAHHNLIICPGDATGCSEGGVAMELLEKPDVRDPDVIPDRTSSLVLGAGAAAVVRTEALEPGTHRLWCAIPNHAARGMELLVEVE
jgi:uncharacterized cupredoxin-like copper-binding protein